MNKYLDEKNISKTMRIKVSSYLEYLHKDENMIN